MKISEYAELQNEKYRDMLSRHAEELECRVRCKTILWLLPSRCDVCCISAFSAYADVSVELTVQSREEAIALADEIGAMEIFYVHRIHRIAPSTKIKNTDMQDAQPLAPVLAEIRNSEDEDEPIFGIRWWAMLGEYMAEISVRVVDSGIKASYLYGDAVRYIKYEGVPSTAGDRCLERDNTWGKWPYVVWRFAQQEDWRKCVLENDGVYSTQCHKYKDWNS